MFLIYTGKKLVFHPLHSLSESSSRVKVCLNVHEFAGSFYWQNGRQQHVPYFAPRDKIYPGTQF